MAYNTAKGGFPSLSGAQLYPEWYQRMLAMQGQQASNMPQLLQSSAPDMSQPQEMSWSLGRGGGLPKVLTGNPSKLPTVQADAPEAPAQKPHYLNFFGRLSDAIFGDGAYANKQAMIQQQAQQAQLQQQQQAALAQQAAALKNAGYTDAQIAAIQNDPSGKILQGYIEQNKPKDPGNDDFTRAMIAAGIQPGSDEYKAMAHKRAEMLTNPVQLVSDGMGGTIAVRTGPASSGPPDAAIKALRDNPSLADQFEAKYGKGSAAQYLGGGAGNGTGNFPRPN